MLDRLPRGLVAASLAAALGVAAAQDADITAGVSRLELIQAQNGNAEAQYYLGTRYEAGLGVPQDLGQAIIWYQQAANGGNAEAQFKLGELYEQGRGVEKDGKQAFAWFSLAASNGNAQAKRRLAEAEARTRAAAQAADEAAKEQARKEAEAQEAARRKAEERQQAALRRLAPAAPAAKPTAPAKPPEPVRPAAAAPAAPAAPPAPVKPAMPDIQDVVLKAKWQGPDGASPFLPSEVTSCLTPNPGEAVCFSRELRTVLDGQELTYTVKATINGFEDSGRFSVAFLYNVVDLDATKAATSGTVRPGLRAAKGWLDPGTRLNCEAVDRRNLRCGYDGGSLQLTAQ